MRETAYDCRHINGLSSPSSQIEVAARALKGVGRGACFGAEVANVNRAGELDDKHSVLSEPDWDRSPKSELDTRRQRRGTAI